MAKRGQCRACGCENRTCVTYNGPCYWVNTEENLCSGCARTYRSTSCLWPEVSQSGYRKCVSHYPTAACSMKSGSERNRQQMTLNEQ